MGRLEGKNVLITGASEGIGKAAAFLFAEEKSNLVLVARSEDKLKKIKEEIESKSKVNIHIAKCDVSKKEECESLKKNLPKEFETIDILINNAGFSSGINLSYQENLEDVESVMGVNFMGVVIMCNLFVPDMVKRNSGQIINVGSIAGHESYPKGSIYNSSKFAVRGYTNSMRMELVSTKVRVSHISPGLVETNFSVVRFQGDEEKAKSVYKGMEALQAQDVADNILYVASVPERVQIADLVVFPTCQGSVYHIHKEQ